MTRQPANDSRQHGRDPHGNIKALLRRGRGYKNLEYLLLKAQRLAATRTEFIAIRKAA
jgi:hypothetical protein